MSGTKEVNSNLDVGGNIKLSTVPNNTGTLLTYNTSTKLISTRTNTEILSDLGLTSVVSNSHTHGNKTVLDGITTTNVTNWNTAYDWGKGLRVDGNGVEVHNLQTIDTNDIKNASVWASGVNRPNDTNSAVVSFNPYINGRSNYGFQIAGRANNFSFRTLTDNVYTEWRNIFHTGNFDPSNYTLLTQTGLPTNLNTTNKTNLVAAINEVNGNTNNIEIGGRNLLPYSELKRYAGGSIFNDLLYYSISNERIIAINQPTGSSLPGWVLHLSGPTQITLSGETSATQVQAYYRCFNDLGVALTSQSTFNISVVNGKFSASMILNLPIDTATVNIGIGITSITNYWLKPKLELGNKATDWTPAPEDQVSDWNETDSTKYSFIKNKPTIPTVNNGQLTLSTGTGLSGSATFTANQAGSSTFSVAVASTHKLPTTTEWNALISPNQSTTIDLKLNTLGDYSKWVIPLFEYTGNASTSTNNWVNLTILCNRHNGTGGTHGAVRIVGGDNHGSAIPRVYIESIYVSNVIEPVTFTYNGKTYFGIKSTNAAQDFSFIIKGDISNKTNSILNSLTVPIVYQQTSSNTVVNTEINNSLLVYSSSSANQIWGNTISKNDITASRLIKSDSSDSYVLLGGGGHKLVSDFALASSLSSYVPTSRTITINGVTQNLSANRTWTVADTVTRLRGTTNGAFTSGDLTLLAGTGIGITQSGTNITITNSSPNIVQTLGISGNTLSLSGGGGSITLPTYTLPTASASVLGGIKVGTNLSIDANGVLSSTNTTYGVETLANLNTGTSTTGLLQSAKNLNDWLTGKGYATTTQLSGYIPTSHVVNAITATNISNWNTAFTNNHTHSNKAILDATTASFTTALKTKLDGLSNYTLPTASTSVLGGIKVGSDLSINASGVLSNSAPNVTQILGLSGNTLSLSNGGGSVNLPTYTDTITRLRGTASGTFTSGDLTLLAGANTTITQSGANITIASTNTNTTYTAGTGINLSGTVFGQTITTSGTGTFVTGVTQTTNGFQINLGTPPNTTYSGGTLAQLQALQPVSTNMLYSPLILNQWFDGKSVFGLSTGGGIKTNTWTSSALSPYSIALGHITSVGGLGAVALGYGVTTMGSGSVNNGYQSTINGNFSSNVGSFNGINASKSTNIGVGLLNDQEGCTVVGRFNAPTGSYDYENDTLNASKKIFIVGGGKDADARKNILETTADYKTKVANNIYYDPLVRNSMTFSQTTLIDKKYFDDNIPSGGGGSSNIQDYSTDLLVDDYNGEVMDRVNVASSTAFLDNYLRIVNFSPTNTSATELDINNLLGLIGVMSPAMSDTVLIKGNIIIPDKFLSGTRYKEENHICLVTNGNNIIISSYTGSSFRTLINTARNLNNVSVMYMKLGTILADWNSRDYYFHFNPQIL